MNGRNWAALWERLVREMADRCADDLYFGRVDQAKRWADLWARAGNRAYVAMLQSEREAEET